MLRSIRIFSWCNESKPDNNCVHHFCPIKGVRGLVSGLIVRGIETDLNETDVRRS